MTRGKLIRAGRVARWSAATVGLLLLLQASATAVIVPLNFGNGSQVGLVNNMTVKVPPEVSGEVELGGGGTVYNAVSKKVENFAFTAPLNHSLKLSPDWRPISFNARTTNRPFFSSTPFDAASAEISHSGPNLSLLDLTSLNFEMGGGGRGLLVPVDTLVVTSNSNVSILKALTVDLSLNDQGFGMQFVQTSAATVGGSNGQGSFHLTGEIRALFEYDAILAGIFPTPIENGPFYNPASFDGVWKIAQAGQKHKLTLDGTLHFVVSDSVTALSTQLSISSPLALTLTITTDLAFSFGISAAVHLEQYFTAPEPGSIVLLGIGLAAITAVAIARRKRPGPCSGTQPG